MDNELSNPRDRMKIHVGLGRMFMVVPEYACSKQSPIEHVNGKSKQFTIDSWEVSHQST